MWQEEGLIIIVYGASGDLARKKTFPALFDLFQNKLLPKDSVIIGYARSELNNEGLYEKIKPFVRYKDGENDQVFGEFCNIIHYSQGQYDSSDDLTSAIDLASSKLAEKKVVNRLFYFALPPNVFTPAAESVKKSGISSTGFTRLIIEKPFGHDTASALSMTKDIGKLFNEESIYRIDHYLGKEMVQGLLTLRFSNVWLESLLNKHFVQSVLITFKEDIGTNGRGGYFDKSGIVRDIMQNHLMQVLSILAMEPPNKRAKASKNIDKLIRDEKVKVLKAIKPWKLDSTVLGQYVGNDKEEGYLDDKTVPNDSVCPTFACTVMEVKNSRWSGVPFIMRAGKALNERKCEIRIQLKAADSPQETPNNEIIIRIQPEPAVFLKTNLKTPGLTTNVDQNKLNLGLEEKYPDVDIPHAYTRLLLDVLNGKQQNFVRSDELLQAWKIVTPLLKQLEKKKIKPVEYVFGTRGPEDADTLMAKIGNWEFGNSKEEV